MAGFRVIKSNLLSDENDVRYVVVSDNGEVVDDSNGEGYSQYGHALYRALSLSLSHRKVYDSRRK